MAAINDLIRQITDPDLRDRIQKEVDKLAKQKKFGLVFEEHLPECTPLYDIPVRRGVKAALKAGDVSDFYQVLKVEEGKAICIKRGETDAVEFSVDNLVTIAEFGEPIYPYLKPIDTVCNAPDSDLWHTLIEADNYHALQLLEYLYAGKVDCIYIDPPYNTGARDWKYNNDYVDAVDEYRHSKWLSFMQKRLALAKRILNPNDSVLIITIDEKEYLHLGCLLEEMFPEASIQMISDVINPHGANRKNMFARVEEYIYFVFFGSAKISHTTCDMLNPEVKREVPWQHLIRGGQSGQRKARPNQFYPIFFDKITGKCVGAGDSLPLEMKTEEYPIPEGCFAVWPINKKNGNESIWGVYPDSFRDKLAKGYIQFGPWKPGNTTRSINFLQSGTVERIEKGEIEVVGKNEDGTLLFGNSSLSIRPLSVWNQTSHSASEQGTSMLNKFFPQMRFSFPKSLYSVRDTLRFFTKDKPGALIVDFFAGSGTTLHAVNLLNSEDGGRRRCILVTNNEISAEERKEFDARNVKPGDKEWESRGIAHYVTWPRTVCAIKGQDVDGNPLKGDYIGTNTAMSDGFRANVIFFKLGFLDKTRVSLGMQFKEMLPLLWMKSGAIGPCPMLEDATPDMMILPENSFAVLTNENQFALFESAVRNNPSIQTVFIVTDYEVNYRAMVKSLGVKTSYQLYRDYLDNFRINHGRN